MNDSKIISNLENLRKIRESKHITQVKLSTDLGISQELISRYEVGNSFPQPNMLIKLANYFNCSVDYLLGLTNIPTPVKYLTSNKEDTEFYELYSKYNLLSDTDKKYFQLFLSSLIDNNNKSDIT